MECWGEGEGRVGPILLTGPVFPRGRGWSRAALSPAPPPSLSPPAMSASSSTCSSRKSSSCVSRDDQDEEFFSMLESINTFGLDMEQVGHVIA